MTAVYVPTAQAARTTLSHVPPGAGIVGSDHHRHVRIDCAAHGQTWADRVAGAAFVHADGRMFPDRSWVDAGEVVCVGTFDGTKITLLSGREPEAARWLGQPTSPEQLTVSH